MVGRLRLRNPRNLIGIVLHIMLCLHSVVICSCASCCVLIGAGANVSVISHRIFSKAIQDVMLMMAKGVDPSSHVLEHLPLNFGPRVVEIWVEKALQSFFCCLTDIDFGITPCLGDQGHDVSYNNLGQITGWLIQNEIKMILAQE